MHRNWLVVAALALAGCFKPSDDSKGTADAGTDSGARAGDAGSGQGNCGNGVIDTGEQCEISPLILNGESCNSATLGGLPNGRLGCDPNCTFNISMCEGGTGAAGIGGVGGAGGEGGR